MFSGIEHSLQNTPTKTLGVKNCPNVSVFKKEQQLFG